MEFAGLMQKVGQKSQDSLLGDAWGAFGATGDYFANLANAMTRYAGETMNAHGQILGSEMTRWGAKYRLQDAAKAAGYAGDVQRSGEEAAANRLLALGQDIGRVYAGAAGGNIDVSSRTVRGIDRAARMMAQRDVAATARTAAAQANRHIDEARGARLGYVGDILSADTQRIQGEYSEFVARSNKKMARYSAAGQLGMAFGRLGLDAALSTLA